MGCSELVELDRLASQQVAQPTSCCGPKFSEHARTPTVSPKYLNRRVWLFTRGTCGKSLVWVRVRSARALDAPSTQAPSVPRPRTFPSRVLPLAAALLGPNATDAVLEMRSLGSELMLTSGGLNGFDWTSVYSEAKNSPSAICLRTRLVCNTSLGHTSAKLDAFDHYIGW